MSESLIVVFGGTGYLGSHIVRVLLEQGFQVRVAARHPESGPVTATGVQRQNQTADIRDEASIRQAIEGAVGVVNAVSLYVEKGGVTFQAIHVEGAERLARCCASAGVPQLVHISGINVDTQSRSAYVSARGRGENRVREVFPRATILRPSVLFGGEGGLMATLDALCRLPVIPLFGRGETRLQPVHVEDVAQAVAAALAITESPAPVYELGGGQVLSYRQLVQLALSRRGRRRPLLPVPFALWYLSAALLSFLPSPPLTRDQLVLMEADNVAHADTPGFASLGLTPRGVGQTPNG
ncbi:MAG: complex I NDUFA9 subunit family protein [Marinobacter sp.]